MEITKENLREFLNLYHYLHDSNIINVNYNIKEAKVEMMIKVFWKGEPKLKDDGYYEDSKVLLKLTFLEVEKMKVYELFSYDYIDDIDISYVTIENKEYIKFEDKDNDILVIAEALSYEEESYV